MPQIQRYHHITADRKEEFVARGYKGKHFFPHRAYYVPRPLPEQLKTARRLWNIVDPDAMWCVLLYGCDDVVAGFPRELFFDRKVMIHNEHMGRPGFVASAHLYLDGDRLCTDEHQSDLVQRIVHRREHKSQIEKRFGTWHHMMLNCILNFAVTRDVREIHVPTSQRVVEQYIGHGVNPEMFERLYDQNIQHHFHAERRADVWVIPVASHRDKLVPMTPAVEHVETPQRSACIIHDVPSIRPGRAGEWGRQIESIIAAEQRVGISSTWCVPGKIMDALREPIEASGGTVAFRGFDGERCQYTPLLSREESAPMAALTRLLRRADGGVRRRLGLPARTLPTATAIHTAGRNIIRRLTRRPRLCDTLRRCRDVDYYLKGYRRTSLDVRAGLDDDWLGYYHFDWVIDDDVMGESSEPRFSHGMMILPIAVRFPRPRASLEHIDDALDRNAVTLINLPLQSWRRWIDHLPALAQRVRQRNASVRSVQEVVNAFHFSRAV